MKYLLAVMVLLNSYTGLQALELSQFITGVEAAGLRSGQIITEVYLKHSPRLSTSGSATGETLSIPETVYTPKKLRKNELIVTEKAYLSGPVLATRLSATLTRFSDLRGMKYYSHKAADYEELVVSAYRTGPSGTEGPLADQVPEWGTREYLSYFFMEDNRFGKLLYRSAMTIEKEFIVLENVCVEPIKRFGFTLMDPEEYRVITFLFRDRETDGWFLYSLTTAPIKSNLFLSMRLVSPKSFGNRMRAATVHLAKGLGIDWSDKLAAFR